LVSDPLVIVAATVAASALVPVVRTGPPAVPLGDALSADVAAKVKAAA